MDGSNSIQENYSYDAAGNLLTKGSKTFTYNSANQITNAGFTYDANGNLTSDGNFIYVYNSLNQLVQVKKVSDGSLVVTYTYNHNGLRKSKTVNGVTTTYNWDASGNLIRESNPSGSSYYYWVGGNLVGLKKNNVTYLTHTNLRGDIESITDVDGNIVAQAHYDPWGNRVAYSGSLVEPFRYAGYYFDDETGLYYLKSRYYSPSLGRFLKRDGISYIDHSEPQTLNLYSYCGNNPVNFSDPEGNWKKGDETLSPDVQSQIVDFGHDWETAHAKGDVKGMHDAEAKADALRAAERARQADINKKVLSFDVTPNETLTAGRMGGVAIGKVIGSVPFSHCQLTGRAITAYGNGRTIYLATKQALPVIAPANPLKVPTLPSTAPDCRNNQNVLR